MLLNFSGPTNRAGLKTLFEQRTTMRDGRTFATFEEGGFWHIAGIRKVNK